MTINELKSVIRENNINKEIKWNVKRIENGFAITNDYAGVCTFTVELCSKEYDDGTEYYIVVRDQNMDELVTVLCKGNDRWDDYTDDEVGLRMAVKAVVKHFYYYY